MPNLAIECSGPCPSIGLFEKDRLVNSTTISRAQGSVKGLAAAVSALITANPQPRPETRIDWITVTIGPGSFTGLRIGIMTAKALAFCWNIRVASIDTLALIARQQLDFDGSIVVPVMNAYRKQVFTAAWEKLPNAWRCLRPSCVVDASSWVMQPSVDERRCLLAGPGLETYRVEPTRTLKIAPEETWAPSLKTLGRLGFEAAEGGMLRDPVSLIPNYVRGSAAEEKARSTSDR